MATITGDAGDNVLRGTQRADSIRGLAGNDILRGRLGGDRLSGDDGNDILRGDEGNDTLDGGGGANALDGGPGFDTITLRTFGAGALVLLSDGSGLAAGPFNIDDGTTDPNADRNSLTSIEAAIGTPFADLFDAGGGSQWLLGENGADELRGGDENDRLEGGPGDDFLDGASGEDSLYGDSGSDSSFGGDGNDFISGGPDDDFIAGEAGRDRLSGDEGQDRLSGDENDDILSGGPGGDDFFFFVAPGAVSGRDLIADFEPSADVITAGNPFFSGDSLFTALDTNQSDILDDGDEFVEIRRLSFEGRRERSTIIDMSGLVADIGASSLEPASITVYGIAGLGPSDITGG